MKVRIFFYLFFFVAAPWGALAAPLYQGKNLYEFFGVSPQDPNPEAAFKARYRALVMQYHPDRNGGNPRAEAATKRLNEFMAEVKKNRYYAHLAPKAKAAPEPTAKPRSQAPPKPEPAPAPEPLKTNPAARAAANAYARTARSNDPCARLFATL